MLKVLISIILIGSSCFLLNDLDSLRSEQIPTVESLKELTSSLIYGYQVYEENGIGKYKHYSHPIKRGPSVNLNYVRNSNNYSDFNHAMNRVVMKVHNGYLVGFDQGEFGGSLYWFDDAGEKHYRIIKGNIKDILRVNNSIFVTDGLEHLSTKEGRVFSLIYEGNKWKAYEFVEINETPYTSQISSSNNLIVVTKSRILEINLDKSITELVSNGFWQHLYPNSSIINNDVIYFGTYKGVVKYDLNNEKLEWLVE